VKAIVELPGGTRHLYFNVESVQSSHQGCALKHDRCGFLVNYRVPVVSPEIVMPVRTDIIGEIARAAYEVRDVAGWWVGDDGAEEP
jgi:hypothetical protein